MPAPNQTNPHQKPWPDFNDWFKDQPETAAALSGEISKLRDEIAALRAELAPVPSLIVTGRQAIDEFKRLTHVEKN